MSINIIFFNVIFSLIMHLFDKFCLLFGCAQGSLATLKQITQSMSHDVCNNNLTTLAKIIDGLATCRMHLGHKING